MDPLLANIDLNSNPYAGTEHDTRPLLKLSGPHAKRGKAFYVRG
jgi:hypothetical protein